MSWAHEQVTLLIDLYKEKPCLYVVKSPLYKNKHARQAAWECICESLKELRPKTSITEIKNKINGLRTNFLAEYRKWQNSKRSGVGDDDVYVPTLWYYKDIMFILDHTLPRSSVENIPDEVNDGTPALSVNVDDINQVDLLDSPNVLSDGIVELDDEHDYCSLQSEEQVCSSASSSKSTSVNTSSKNKRKCDRAELELIQSATNALKGICNTLTEKKQRTYTPPVVKDHIKTFTEFVESRIRLFTEETQNEVMEKITHILFNP